MYKSIHLHTAFDAIYTKLETMELIVVLLSDHSCALTLSIPLLVLL